MFFIYYLVFLFFFTLLLRPFSTLIHELGHGIPALLLTDKKVTLYLGSYGDAKESFKVVIGRLELYFNKKPFNWNVGLCVLEKQTLSINKQIFIDLMGPLASLVLSLVLSFLVFFSNLNDSVIIILSIFNISTYYDFFANIVPSNKPIELQDGSSVYNDGRQILDLLKLKKIHKDYNLGVELYNNKEYKLAALSFEKAFNKGFQEDTIYKLLVSSYIEIKDYTNATRVDNLYSSKFKETFNSIDYINSGLLKSLSGNFDNAIKDYNNAIKFDPENSIALNNRGYTYNVMEDYEKAIIDFNKAISLEESFAYALNNRGFAKIKLGLKTDGLADLKKSMALDGINSYCYLNFGIYHYDNKEYQKALDYFKKAEELDNKTFRLANYLQDVNEKLGI